MAEKMHKQPKNVMDDKEEVMEKKEKGGRDGKKAKEGMKRGKKARFVIKHLMFHPSNPLYRKTSANKAKEEAATKAAAKMLQ